MPEPNHPVDHCDVSSEEPLNSESNARFHGPTSWPTGWTGPDVQGGEVMVTIVATNTPQAIATSAIRLHITLRTGVSSGFMLLHRQHDTRTLSDSSERRGRIGGMCLANLSLRVRGRSTRGQVCD